jgi:hypothetical protein
MSTNELPVEARFRMFLDPEAPLGQTWLNSDSSLMSAESLHALALNANIPLIVKAQNMYGHFRTASHMNKVSGRYWKLEPELLAYLEKEPLGLNPQPLQTSMEHLQTLHTDAVGGIISVTKQYSNDGLASSPFITIVAAPSLAPLGEFSMADPPGISITNY